MQSGNPHYPRWIECDGKKFLVQNTLQHKQFVGHDVNDDGTPVEQLPLLLEPELEMKPESELGSELKTGIPVEALEAPIVATTEVSAEVSAELPTEVSAEVPIVVPAVMPPPAIPPTGKWTPAKKK